MRGWAIDQLQKVISNKPGIASLDPQINFCSQSELMPSIIKKTEAVFSNIASHPIGARDRIATPVRRDAMRCDDFRSDPIASLSHRPEYSLT